jgi:hypothetical protein
VGGRLLHFASFWKRAVSDAWVLDLITYGHSIEFTSKPRLSSNVRWTRLQDTKKARVLDEEIVALLQKDAIEEVDPLSLGYYSTFFVVPKRDGGFRPILNLKPLNQFVQYQKFRMETHIQVLQYLRRGDWLASLDLKDAYLHIPILPAHRPYLRFAFRSRVYQFKVLPFGLSSAPRVFTSVLASLVGILHTAGIQFIPYLDDCLIVARSRELLLQNIQSALDLLTQAGFIINEKKSHLVPTQDLIFLGMRVRTDLGTVHLPLEKAQRLAQSVEFCFHHQTVSAHFILRILGLMASCLRVVPAARLLMRPIQMFFLSRWNFKTKPIHFRLSIPESLLQFLAPWRDLDLLTKGVPIEIQSPTRTITTDASNLGWGGHILIHDKSHGVQGKWDSVHRSLHINCLELLAVQRTLQAFQYHLRGHTVLVMTDNTSVRQYINKQGGTKSHTLCALTLKLFQWCQSHDILLVAQHVPGIENTLADRLSRQFCPDTEWRLNPSVVQRLFDLWGSPNIDLFATEANKHCPVFASWQEDPRAFHVDALTLDWSGMFVYAFPPIPILPLVVQKLLRDRPEMILITPFWPRRPWFPQLLPLLIDHPVRLPHHTDLLTQDRGRVVHPNLSSPHDLQPLLRNMSHAGSISLSGAGETILIPFQVLSQMS